MERALIDREVLTQSIERPRLGGVGERLLPQRVEPLNGLVVVVLSGLGILCVGLEEALLDELVAERVQPQLLEEHPGLGAGRDIHHAEVVSDEEPDDPKNLVAETRQVPVHDGLHRRGHSRRRGLQRRPDVPKDTLHGGAPRAEPHRDRCIIPMANVEVLVGNRRLVRELVVVLLGERPMRLRVVGAAGPKHARRTETAEWARESEGHDSTSVSAT
mmetsp:Transcript_104116/g.293627  ORF Transcript_104116/g.293627 Transcript_104116/m.293627 type:complete len:216 (+) Transcript_104116:370-1017(+)